jgi:hypothetical protein
MKRLPFNTITIFWGIVILLASCAFTSKTPKAQSETVQQEQTKSPTSNFLEKVKAKNGCLNGTKWNYCYDFREFDFEDYEKPTFENLFTTYADLFNLSEHDEMKPLRPIQYRDKKALPVSLYGKDFTQVTFRYLHKGFPVYWKKDYREYEITVYGDSIGAYVWKATGKIISNLDVDTTVTVSSKEAFKTAKSVVPIQNDEVFIFEQSITVIPEEQRNQINIPNINFKIYQGRLTYSYLFATRKNVLPLVPYKTYEVFVDAQTNKVLYLKKPSDANHLATSIAENKKVNKAGDCKLLIENEVKYTVENSAISGANNEFLEFDINVASMFNNENFYSGEMLIDYNSLTFGTNLASSERITLTKGTVITAPNYTLSIVDVSSDQMKIIAQSTPSNPSNYYSITNQSEELAHIKIDISNLAGNTAIKFDEVQMQGLSELFDASLSSNTPFDLVTAIDELNVDINGILNSGDTCTTCTGGNITTTFTSSSQINVFYAVTNADAGSSSTRDAVINLTELDTTGGVTFYLGEVLDSIPNTREIIEASLCLWKEKTGVNFNLSDSIITNPTANALDGLNVIYMVNDVPPFSMETVVSKQTTSLPPSIPPGGRYSWVTDIDIKVARYTNLSPLTLKNWNYTNNPPAANEIDFYAAIIHEFGHSHSLSHVIGMSPDTLDGRLMFPILNIGENIARRNIDATAIAGGLFVLQHSTDTLTALAGVLGSTAPTPMTRTLNFDCIVNSTNDIIENITQVKLYPNPFNNLINIEYELLQSSEVTLQVYDITGKEIQRENLGFQTKGAYQRQLKFSLPKGIYFVKVQTDYGFKTLKVIKH